MSFINFKKMSGATRGIPDGTGPYGRGMGPGKGTGALCDKNTAGGAVTVSVKVPGVDGAARLPDGTGPHGRGMGPGKGKGDGTGLKVRQEIIDALEEEE